MKQKFSKLLTTMMIALLLLGAFPAFATSEDVVPAPAVLTASQANGDMTVQSDSLQWYYRIYNGQTQKRLWSHNLGMWLTNWIPV